MLIKVCVAFVFRLKSPDPLIDGHYENLPIKGSGFSEAQKQKPYKHLWTF